MHILYVYVDSGCFPGPSDLSLMVGKQAGGDDSENGPMGPAPNSGDGVPDGSGIDAPNGPNR